MVKPEAKLLLAVVKLLDRLKKEGHPIWFVKIAGGPRQRRGLPDLHITYYGRSVWIELKAPGCDPTPLQAHRLKEIDAAGGIVACCRSAEEVESVLQLAAGRYEEAVERIKGAME
jgi:hypothetical protein